MQVGVSSKDDRSFSLREVYGEKLGSFLEAKESCYRSWNRSEPPEKLWRDLQEEKEHYLFQLVSSGLRFSEEVQNEVDWRDMFGLLQKSELSLEYPFSLPYGSAAGGGASVEVSESEAQLLGSHFSPKWGVSAGKSGYPRADKRRVGDKAKKAPFVMDERQWQLAGYEVVLLCMEFIRRNMGELRLQITRLEDRRLRMESVEEQSRGGSGACRRGGSGQQGRFSSAAEERTEHYNFSRLCSDQGDSYDKLQSLHSKLTRDCDNLTSIYNSLLMFSEMARIRFRIDSSTDYLIGTLSSRFDSGGMGFFSSEDIHPLEVRYRVLLLIESWSKSDTHCCRSSTWEHGKLRIKPGGAPRIVPELSGSRMLKEDPEFKSWVHRQVHIIYSNLAFKLQRLVMFIPPGWLQYLPGEIDLRDMLDLKSKSWSCGDKTIGLGINKELLSEGVQRSLGRNPQSLLEFALESISILDKLRAMVDLGFWGDLSYLKSADHKVNGRDLLNRLLNIMSEMEKLDLAIRRDVSQNSLKSVSPTFHINLSSYCVDFSGNKDKALPSKGGHGKQDSHAYVSFGPTGTGSVQVPGSFQLDHKKHQGHVNKRQLIYSNELVRDSIEEKLLALPSLSSYWMLESQVVHVLIRTLMSINVSPVDPDSIALRGAGLASMGLHQYSPFISRCIVFTGYMLENGIFVDEDLEYMNKLTVTSRTNIIPTSMETYSLYLASSIWTCYENFLSYRSLRSVSGARPEAGHESLLGADASGLRTGETDSSGIQDLLFSVLDLVLRDLPGFLKHQTVSGLEEELSCPPSQPLSNASFSVSQPPVQKTAVTGGSETASKEVPKPAGSNVRSRFHSNSRELLRKITSGREAKGASAEKSLKESKEEDLDEDIAHLNRFCKISSFLVQIQGRRTSSNSNVVLSQPILRQSDQLWMSPDWMISLGGGASTGEKGRRKEESPSDQLWRVFGISLTTSSRAERVYGEILVRRMNTLSFRSRILCLCQNFFRLGAPRILRKLLQIVSRVNTFLVLEDDESLSALTRRANMGQIGPDKRLWTRYCNYCILRSNELKIRELFEVPMQMLRLPATHYVELKLRLKSRDIRESQEKERMERLARQEIQGCLETFIHSFQFLEDVHIWETITGWSRVMYEGASLTAGGGSISLVRDYVLITVRLLEVYVPYYMQELMSSEYWDLVMVPKSQFEDLVSSIIAIDKYMVILRNWLEFNLDSVKIQSRIIDAQMIYNQSGTGSASNSHAELKLQEMMRRRYLNDHLQQVTLLSLFSPQFILLVQNRISNIEHLVYKVYQSNQGPGTTTSSSAWTTGINPPDIYTSSIMIDIGTIVNTGVESLVEWLIFPLEDEQSLTLCLSPIMKFYRDITTFVVNTIKRELCCKKYEMVDSYIQYTMDILSVLSKSGAGMNGGSSLGTSLTQELRNLVKIHNIPSLARQVISFSNSSSQNTGTGMTTTIINSGSNSSSNNNNSGGGVNGNSSSTSNSMNMNSSVGGGGDLLGIGSGGKLGTASWNRSKGKLAVEGVGGVSEAMLAEKFERGSLFFSLLNLCLRLEDEDKGGPDGGRAATRSMGERNVMGKSENRYINSNAGTACTNVDIASCMNYLDNNTQDIKFLVSIHNLLFFKDIIFETSSKFFSLFFGSSLVSADKEEGGRRDHGQDDDHDLEKKRYRAQNKVLESGTAVSSASASGGRSKQRGGGGSGAASVAPAAGFDQGSGAAVSASASRRTEGHHQRQEDFYRLPDEVLVKMKKMLEFLRNYGAMDNDENKLLASESTVELNRLLFSQEGTGSVFAEPQALKRHRDLFLNLLGECVQNIDSLVAYIFRMYCVKTISCTFGLEFYLRIYGTGLLNGIQNRSGRDHHLGDANKNGSYSYTSSYEEEAALSLESLLPGLNSCFRDFLSRSIPPARTDVVFRGGAEEEEGSGRFQDVGPEGGEIFSLLSRGISTRSQLEAEFNKEYMRSLELLWLSHIFELSQSKADAIFSSSFADEVSPLFEYDFEILDELRRSLNVSDYSYDYHHSAGKDDVQVKIMASDTVLYFITQFLPNRKLVQHKIFKDLTLLSALSSEEDAGPLLLREKGGGSSHHTSSSSSRAAAKALALRESNSSNSNSKQQANNAGTGGWYYPQTRSKPAPQRLSPWSSGGDHHELENTRASSNAGGGGRSSSSGGGEEAEGGGGGLVDYYYSSITRQLSGSRRPSQIVSKIIKNSHSGQRKIKSFISRSLLNNHH